MDNVVCYITFEGAVSIISENQIDDLKLMLKQNEFEIEVSHENFEPGTKVEIIQGPLIGLQGELITNRGKNKFVLHIKQISSFFTIEVPASHRNFLPPEKEL